MRFASDQEREAAFRSACLREDMPELCHTFSLDGDMCMKPKGHGGYHAAIEVRAWRDGRPTKQSWLRLMDEVAIVQSLTVDDDD